MVVLRCTQKLLVQLKQFDGFPPVESTTRLGDWYGNILQIGRVSIYSSSANGPAFRSSFRWVKESGLGTVFPDAVCERLAIVGVAAGDIADERARMSEIAFGRTRNRSLLVP